jgi:hypothetical protein
MALPNVNVVRSQGAVVRPSLSEDTTSGMIFYSNTYPSGFSASNQVKVVTSSDQAYSLGIVDDFSDEIQATASIVVTATMSNDTLTLAFNAPLSYTFSLTGLTGSTTASAVQIKNQINNSYSDSGILATVNASTVILQAPLTTLDVMYGANVNGVTASISGTGAAKVSGVTFSGGVNPLTTVWKYHIDEYFRLGRGQLYIGVFPVPGTWNFNELETLQNAALGQCRQVAIFKSGTYSSVFSSSDTSSIQTKCNSLSTARRPLVAVLQPNIKNLVLADLDNLTQYSNTNVAVTIGQDGANVGKKLYDIFGYSVGIMGAVLGCISNFRVSESIGWVAKLQSLPFSTAEYDTPAFGNGVEYKTLTTTDLNSIADKNYIFLRKFEGLAGSFISDSKTAVSNTSDFFSLERNRTIDKARRLTYTALVPFVNSPLEVDSAGKLSPLTITVFTQTINTQLTTMTSAGELSGFQVVIDPNQNVTATDTININLFLQPIGVARFVEVKVSFTVAAVTTT